MHLRSPLSILAFHIVEAFVKPMCALQQASQSLVASEVVVTGGRLRRRNVGRVFRRHCSSLATQTSLLTVPPAMIWQSGCYGYYPCRSAADGRKGRQWPRRRVGNHSGQRLPTVECRERSIIDMTAASGVEAGWRCALQMSSARGDGEKPVHVACTVEASAKLAMRQL